MSFQDKLEAAQKELSEANIWKSNHNPPISVLLRKIGFNIRPFHYCSFKSNFLQPRYGLVLFGGFLCGLPHGKMTTCLFKLLYLQVCLRVYCLGYLWRYITNVVQRKTT